MSTRTVKSAREEARRELIIKAAARVIRERGLASTTMEDIASEIGVSRLVVYRRFSSKDALIQAILERVDTILFAPLETPWRGLGDRVAMQLARARQFEDGYVILTRDVVHAPQFAQFYTHARMRTADGLATFMAIEYEQQDPLRRDLAFEPMISFLHTAIEWWIQNGDPKNDNLFLQWTSSNLLYWRKSACSILGLGDPNVLIPISPDLPPSFSQDLL